MNKGISWRRDHLFNTNKRLMGPTPLVSFLWSKPQVNDFFCL